MAQFAEKAPDNFISTRNACKLCAPLGAGIAFRGIQSCIPLVHGSQGCATYIRRYIISHFREPVDIASSNFSEDSAIFGGGDNLKKALDNIIRQYEPEAIGIATTCLSETIGDDIRLYLEQYRAAAGIAGLPAIIHASTPSFSGTHMEGFHKAVQAAVESLAENTGRHGGINLLPGFLSPADLRYLKDVLAEFGADYCLLPDYSETLDGESWPEYQKLSKGGTPIEAIRKMGGASGTIQFGRSLAGPASAAGYLETSFGVKAVSLGVPIGIRETDAFFDTLEKLTGMPTPSKYVRERGRLVDSYIDGHKYTFGKRAIIYGEMDFVAGMASFLCEIGINPVLCATGAASGDFRELVSPLISNNIQDTRIVDDTDFATMLELCSGMEADIIIGNSKGYYLSRRLGIPLVRVGFPIHDRIGAQRILHVGYAGTQQLFDRIVNALIESRQDGSPIGYSYM
ncbi:MAG: nitrogenase [Syntrophaceae bacterium]|nr:nitrogenase [Syntrophaceae bacterium]